MKKRNKRSTVSFLSVLLSLCLLLAMTPTVSAETNDTTQMITATQIQEEIFVLPDAIKEIEPNAQYIGRDKEAESLYTFVFKNQDGTRTMKLFDYPVKYQDQNGDLKDISTDIQALSDGTFRTKENAVITTFSKQLSNGISLEHEDVSVKLLPVISGNTSEQLTATDTATLAASLSEDQKTVTYPYGEKTRLEYSLTYTGFKEDIVVQEYTGQTEYHFLLQTNGLTLQKIHESYFLTDSEGNTKATLGDIIIFTADEKNNTMGGMTHETLRENQLYGLTIHVDAEYLQDENTAYPIRIDPTVEINYDNSGAGAIEDVTLNSSGTSNGSTGALYIGKRGSYGISRVLMKFPALNLNVVFSRANIAYATVKIRDVLCESSQTTIDCYTYAGGDWSESTVTWANTNPQYYTTYLSSNVISYQNGNALSTPHYYQFEITSAVQGWKDGTLSQNSGIMFKAADSVENGSANTHRTFASYNRASNKPIFTIVYANPISTSWGTVEARGSYLNGTDRIYTFTPSSSGTYIIETSQPHGYTAKDTRLFLYNSSNQKIAENDDIGGGVYYSRITTTLSAGTTYKVQPLLYPYNTTFECYLTIYRQGSLEGSLELYTSYMKNFNKIGDSSVDYNCLAYSLGMVDHVEWPFYEGLIKNPSPSLTEVEEYLSDLGYSKVPSPTSNCIVAYGPSDSGITHFSKIQNGIVSAKCGTYEVMEHSYYDAYYSDCNYGVAKAFFVK